MKRLLLAGVAALAASLLPAAGHAQGTVKIGLILFCLTLPPASYFGYLDWQVRQEAKATQMGVRRIVFDAIDVLLALLPDEAMRRREVHRLHQWLLDHELTALITVKALYELQRIGGRYALVTMCIGGGQGIAAIFERI